MFKRIFIIIKNVKNKKLLAAWIAGILLVSVMSLYYAQSYVFFGLTDTKEIVINYDKPVSLRRIYVQLGQKVKQGDLLLELQSTDIDMRINEVNSELDQLSAQKKLMSELRSGAAEGAQNPDMRDTSTNSLDVRISGLKKDLKLLMTEKEKLLIYSMISGTICSINHNTGEKVIPFSPIINICPEFPATVTGYIQENLYSKVSVGQSVIVKSMADPFIACEGKITDTGSRIIPMPEHIKKISGIPLWGREVMIDIPSTNTFLLGEKVVIEVQRNFLNTFLNIL